MTRCISIDLGNQSTKSAQLQQDGTPVDNLDPLTGLPWTPTALWFAPNGEIIYGDEAVNSRKLNPAAFARGEDVKQRLATPWTMIGTDGELYTAKELFTGLIANGARRLAATGDEVTHVLLTFPENFAEPARREALEAVRAAELIPLDSVSEPVAAATYVLLRDPDIQVVGIVDIGHGTTDVALVRREGKTLRVVATGGIRDHGGRQYRNLLKNIFLERLSDLAPDVTPDWADSTFQRFAAELDLAAERVLTALSGASSATMIAQLPGRDPLQTTVTREEFEEKAQPLANEVAEVTAKVKADAALPEGASLRWVMVGGASRIPLIRATLEEKLGSPVYLHPDAATAIARGAAIIAGERLKELGKTPTTSTGQKVQTSGVSVVMVAPYTLGVLSHQGGAETPLRLAPIVFKNAPLPAQQEKLFGPIYQDQGSFDILVAQGDADAAAAQCTIIGRLRLELDRPANPGQFILSVSFGYDRVGQLKVAAKDTRNGKAVHCLIHPPDAGAANSAA